MTPTQSEGSIALHTVSDLLHALLSAETGLHADGYSGGEEACHRHPLLSEARELIQGISSRLDAHIAPARPRQSFEDAMRKYATTGEAGMAAGREVCRCGHTYSEHLEFQVAGRQTGCTAVVGQDGPDHDEYCQCFCFGYSVAALERAAS